MKAHRHGQVPEQCVRADPGTGPGAALIQRPSDNFPIVSSRVR